MFDLNFRSTKRLGVILWSIKTIYDIIYGFFRGKKYIRLTLYSTKKKKKRVYILGGNLAIWINKFIDYK